jgi:two-component system, LuxR family, response regulator FixJ
MHPARGILFIIENDLTAQMALAALATALDIDYKLFSSAEEFLDYYDPSLAGCALIDVYLKGIGGLQLQERLAAMGSILPVILLGDCLDVPLIERGMKNGAQAFIQKSYQANELIEAIRTCFEINKCDSESISNRENIRCGVDTLNSRECSLMEYVLEGIPNKRIAYVMGISHRTVDRVRASLFKKMNVKSAVELARVVAQCRTSNIRSMNKMLS